MQYRILTEASGSLTSHYLIKSIKDVGVQAVASDIIDCAGFHFADDFIIMPKTSNPDLWGITERLLIEKKINAVIPSLDETLLGWAERKDYFKRKNIDIILSDYNTVKVCQDKWETYNFFKNNNIPTPETSLEYIYPLVKPRLGRGGSGISINKPKDEVDMEGMISQEFLEGTEYTIDVFCNNQNEAIYVIPRKRLQVKEGKSLNGITVHNEEIISLVREICRKLPFVGPINIQCFVCNDGKIKFTEINPRIAGGMALGFAASENWIKLILDNIISGKPIQAKDVVYGLKMFRFYDEIFVS
ncbi:MAG: ATP-grasp domain-containing protein [Bacteroidetes bacterium]|nr:ATP-grasp domain-containing protein [Bacteroidota bacterium]